MGFNIKIQMDLSTFSGFKKHLLWVLNITILVITMFSILIIYFTTKKIQQMIDGVVSHLTNSSRIAQKTGIREIDFLVEKYDELVKNLNEQLKLKEEFTLILKHNIEERDKLQQKLEKLALTDELTGVYNRRATISFLSDYLKDLTSKLSVCYFDVDHLKLVNDRLGHLCGDKLLSHVVDIVKEHVRRSDLVARFGGDEFLIIFPHTSKEQAQSVLDRIVQNLQREKPECLKNFDISISYGLVEIDPDKPADVDQIIKLADERMYNQKKEKQGQSPHSNFESRERFDQSP